MERKFSTNRIPSEDLEIARIKFLQIILDENYQQIYWNKDLARSILQNLRMLLDNELYETF